MHVGSDIFPHHQDNPKTNHTCYFRQLHKHRFMLLHIIQILTLPSIKCLQMISVGGSFFSRSPCFFSTTSFNLSSSQSAIVSSCSSSRLSKYKLFFSPLRSIVRSWENLHLSPLPHWPDLKKAQSTDLGSTPLAIFWATVTGLKSRFNSSSCFCFSSFLVSAFSSGF